MSKSQLKRFVSQGALVIAKCISCNDRREIRPGEIEPGDQPMCAKCGSPMIAVSAQKLGVRKP